jgi:hypothetical protein
VKEVKTAEFTDGKQILEYLISYLFQEQSDTNLNQTLAGYFAKTFTSILNVKGIKVILLFYLLISVHRLYLQ